MSIVPRRFPCYRSELLVICSRQKHHMSAQAVYTSSIPYFGYSEQNPGRGRFFGIPQSPIVMPLALPNVGLSPDGSLLACENFPALSVHHGTCEQIGKHFEWGSISASPILSFAKSVTQHVRQAEY